MLVIASLCALIGIIQLSIWRTRDWICSHLVITPEKIEDFKLNNFWVVYTFTTKFNRGHGDAKIQGCLIESMTNIKNYYSTLNEQTKFEAFRAAPYIIHMFGRDYSHDPKLFWIASGIFFDIITKISLNEQLIDTKIEIICEVFKYFGDNCIPFCLKGFADKSFYKVFPKPFDQKLALFAILSSSKDEEKPPILAKYLLHSDLGSAHLGNVLDIIKEKKFDFAEEVFSELATEAIQDYLKKKFDTRKLLLLQRYTRENKLLPKTQLKIMNKILFEI